MKINEYFDGNVKSITRESTKGITIIGILVKGEYEFVISALKPGTLVYYNAKKNYFNSLDKKN